MRITPIHTRDELLASISIAEKDPGVRWYVERTAKALGATDLIPEGWERKQPDWRDQTPEIQAQVEAASEEACQALNDYQTDENSLEEAAAMLASIAAKYHGTDAGIESGKFIFEHVFGAISDHAEAGRISEDEAAAFVASVDEVQESLVSGLFGKGKRKVASAEGVRRYGLPKGTPLDGRGGDKAVAKIPGESVRGINSDNPFDPTLADITNRKHNPFDAKEREKKEKTKLPTRKGPQKGGHNPFDRQKPALGGKSSGGHIRGVNSTNPFDPTAAELEKLKHRRTGGPFTASGKPRRVASPEGAKHFGQPEGSIIVPDADMKGPIAKIPRPDAGTTVTAPNLSYSKDVPIHKLPVGSEVETTNARGKTFGKVGSPIDNGDGTFTARYRDGTGAWDYVQPETTFTTGNVPGDKAPPKAFASYNAPKAAAKPAPAPAAKEPLITDGAKWKSGGRGNMRIGIDKDGNPVTDNTPPYHGAEIRIDKTSRSKYVHITSYSFGVARSHPLPAGQTADDVPALKKYVEENVLTSVSKTALSTEGQANRRDALVKNSLKAGQSGYKPSMDAADQRRADFESSLKSLPKPPDATKTTAATPTAKPVPVKKHGLSDEQVRAMSDDDLQMNFAMAVSLADQGGSSQGDWLDAALDLRSETERRKAVGTSPTVATPADSQKATPNSGADSKAVASKSQTFTTDKQESYGTIDLSVKRGDPARFEPKTSYSDGTKPAKGQKVYTADGREGTVVDTFQDFTAVKFDDNGKRKTVQNKNLNLVPAATPKMATTDPNTTTKPPLSAKNLWSSHSDDLMIQTAEQLAITDPNSSLWPKLNAELSRRGITDKVKLPAKKAPMPAATPAPARKVNPRATASSNPTGPKSKWTDQQLTDRRQELLDELAGSTDPAWDKSIEARINLIEHEQNKRKGSSGKA